MKWKESKDRSSSSGSQGTCHRYVSQDLDHLANTFTLLRSNFNFSNVEQSNHPLRNFPSVSRTTSSGLAGSSHFFHAKFYGKDDSPFELHPYVELLMSEDYKPSLSYHF